MPRNRADIRSMARVEFSGMLSIHPDYEHAFANGDIAPRAGWEDDDQDAPPYVRRGNIAIVSIRGGLSQKGGYWWDGHESIRGRIERAAIDPNIGAIALEVNSPGGVVAGCWDNIAATRAALDRAKKPIFGFAREHGYSAAYAWLAGVCDEIYLPISGGVGSIGVLTLLCDYTKMLDEAGVKYVVVRSGERKARGMGIEVLDDETVSEQQKLVDMLASQFFELVKTARGLSTATIRDYEGACFNGADAVQKKLANGVLSWDAFLEKAEQAGRKYRMKSTALMLGLAEDATEREINAAIEALLRKSGNYDALVAQNADTTIAFAIRTGRITAGQESTERATLIDSPINGAKSLLARAEMGAVPAATTAEIKVVNPGGAPAAANPWAQIEAMADQQLGAWFAAHVATNAAFMQSFAASNPKLFARAENAFKVAR